MGIRGILKSKDLNDYLPHISRKFKPRTTFSYGPTVGKTILNYNKVLNTLTKEDLSVSYCDCNSKYATFVYAPHGHVHTGQLDIIDDIDLRGILAMGAKFRLTLSVTKAKIWNSLYYIILVAHLSVCYWRNLSDFRQYVGHSGLCVCVSVCLCVCLSADKFETI